MMRRAYRVADVRAAEQALMATLPDGALMQRAATGLARRCAELLADRYGRVYGRRVLLLVGSGDNGGDALYAGAALARRGAAVEARLLNPDRAHAGGLAALRAAGGRVVDHVPATTDLVVDGILGIGGRGGLRADASTVVADASLVPAADGAHPPVVAVDVPSGIDVDTGNVEGRAVRADVTVTFGVLKPGLLVGAGAVHSGLVELVDIGLTPWLRGSPALLMPTLEAIQANWPRPDVGDDKYTRGVVGVATGSATYPGAAVLSVTGALAGPTGMVRYAGSAAAAVRQRHPSVIATDRVADAGRVQAWVCGSGLGTDERAAAEVRSVLAAPVPVCLDADGLNLLVDGSMSGLLRERSAPIVVTPHDREYQRLAGHPPGGDRVADALDLATRMRAVVLLKGNRTIVATPDGRAYVNPTGSPALATGGSGDVLAGILGSLLAGGLAPEVAAISAAYVHGMAGRLADGDGPATADTVAERLRSAVRLLWES
jgi:ADP-dependent NAD(P)H-hydrate dehydratase / NAD(P)H-hydrate epimerase